MPKGNVNGSFPNEYPETLSGAANSATDGVATLPVAHLPLAARDLHCDDVHRIAITRPLSAAQISDPALREPVVKRAECAAALAERFEAVRKRREA